MPLPCVVLSVPVAAGEAGQWSVCVWGGGERTRKSESRLRNGDSSPVSHILQTFRKTEALSSC